MQSVISLGNEARANASSSFRAFWRAALCAFSLVAFLAGASIAEAAVTEQAPPIDGFFENNPTIGGGAVLPLAKFRLVSSTGSDSLSKVGVTLAASTSLANGSISRLSLWKESGTKPGFQLDSDTFITGAASTSVTTGLLTVLTASPAASISTAGTEYYVVGSTTAAASLTNGHGLRVEMDANYASTTDGSTTTGVGTAFISNRKVSLNQSATLKISEVRIGSATSPIDEFIELYNSGEADINLQDLPLALHKFYTTGSSSPVSIAYEPTTKVIPSHGYFLITNPNGYQGTARDARFATSTFNVLVTNGGFSIATSTSGTTATSTAFDFVGGGTQGAGNCEN